MPKLSAAHCSDNTNQEFDGETLQAIIYFLSRRYSVATFLRYSEKLRGQVDAMYSMRGSRFPVKIKNKK